MAAKSINVTKFHGMTVAELSALHTGTLMSIRKRTYGRAVCECCGEANTQAEREFNYAQQQLLNNVLEVLATRPHIPNKMERKAARQQAAKQGKRK